MSFCPSSAPRGRVEENVSPSLNPSHDLTLHQHDIGTFILGLFSLFRPGVRTKGFVAALYPQAASPAGSF